MVEMESVRPDPGIAARRTKRLFALAPLASGLLIGFAALAQDGAVMAVIDQDELDESRALAAAGDFEQALPYARAYLDRVKSHGSDNNDLVEALVNLGTVQFNLKDYAAAEMSLGKAIYAIESTEGIVSRRLIEPLALLGSTYAAAGRSSDAAMVLNRAVLVTRRTDGLFNVQQLPLLESLATSLEAVGDSAAVERELRFLVLANQQQFGEEDPRTLDAIMKLAESFLRAQRYDLARVHFQQVATIAARGDLDAGPEVRIHALLGVERSHRLEYVNDPKALLGPEVPIDPITGRLDLPEINSRRVTVIKPNRAGAAAARDALTILDSTPGAPAHLVFETLVELGDWYMTARKPRKAMPYYARAWDVAQASEVRLAQLTEPRELVFRRPGAAIRSRDRWEGTVAPREIEFSLTITEAGQPEDVTAVTRDAPDGQVGQLRRALETAIFSPRLEAGRPIETRDYRITEYWYDGDSPATSEARTSDQTS
jgi:tetratricopeptide (TPR) repeat protein